MKNNPSAFIPFCDYNGDMLAVGEHMDNFSFPVCNAFTPSVIDGQLCYMFDPSTIQSNITYDKPYLIFLLDYNEDKEYPAYKTDINTPYLFYIGRILTSLGTGGFATVGPVYISEVVETSIRGSLGTEFCLTYF